MKLETNVPRVIFGTMNFGRQLDEAAADRMVGLFLDLARQKLAEYRERLRASVAEVA